MNVMTIEKLQSIFTKKGYKWDSNLNIIGVRTVNNKLTNQFDDKLYVFYKDGDYWKLKSYTITTDPGKYYLTQELLNPKGCAILKEGQYINSHSIGLHQGKYEALVQRGNLTVYRDRDKDNDYDYVNPETGSNFGINIHCAGMDSILIDKWSGGCLVFKRKSEFSEFMDIMNRYKNITGNKFTLTLINSND